MSTHGANVKSRYIPPVDAGALSLNAQLITTATTYDGTLIDLGSAYNGGVSELGMWFIPSSDLAGGTSLTFKLLADADGTAGSEVIQTVNVTQTLSGGYEPVCLPIPANLGLRYVGARVVSVGSHSPGSVTAFVGPIG